MSGEGFPTGSDAKLLGADDPSPVAVINSAGRSPFLLIGDHAGNAIPKRLGDLGLSEVDRARHIAWDIGVEALGRCLSARLDAVFLRQRYSRLVIDCNRDPDSAEAVPMESDGSPIPGNARLSHQARMRRLREIQTPYQKAIAGEIGRRVEDRLKTVLVSLHSFTSSMNGTVRPWSIGVLHNGANDLFARDLLAILQAIPGFIVGDNEPYRMDATDFTVPHHAFDAGLPYVEIEFAQRELADDWLLNERCELLTRALKQVRVE